MKVSGLCVTRGRVAMLRKAIMMFANQDGFDPKEWELIVVYNNDDLETHDFSFEYYKEEDKWIKWINISNQNLGYMRNVSVECASGEFCVVWDDDDIHGPRRVKTQLEYMKKYHTEAHAFMTLMFEKDGVKYKSNPRMSGWEGTLICRRLSFPLYEQLPKGEDTPLLKHLSAWGKLNVSGGPDHYTYVVHGNNTHDAKHFDWMLRTSKKVR